MNTLFGAFTTTVMTPGKKQKTGKFDDTSAETPKQVSAFITVESFTNLSAMTGGIAAAWGALANISHDTFDGRWFPLTACLLFGLVSVLASGLGRTFSLVAPALFVAAINSLTLFGAVLGARGLIT